MRENRIEAELRAATAKAGGRCLKFVSPGNRGVPDRLCLLPGGRIAFIETKRPGEHVDPDGLQQVWLDVLQSLGFTALEVNCVADAWKCISDLKTQPRSRCTKKEEP